MVGGAEFLYRVRHWPIFGLGIVQKLAKFIRDYKNIIILGKTKVEFLFFFYILSLWLINGRATIFCLIMHGFYLKMKISIVYMAKYSYGEIIETV